MINYEGQRREGRCAEHGPAQGPEMFHARVLPSFQHPTFQKFAYLVCFECVVMLVFKCRLLK